MLKENIPDSDRVNRLILKPRMIIDDSFIWGAVFEFPGNLYESVVWSKYAPSADDVHKHGHQLAAKVQTRRPDAAYVGYLEAIVGDVRSYRSAKEHGFKVEHYPEEGEHHAGVAYDQNEAQTFTSLEKNELKLALKKIFANFVKC